MGVDRGGVGEAWVLIERWVVLTWGRGIEQLVNGGTAIFGDSAHVRVPFLVAHSSGVGEVV